MLICFRLFFLDTVNFLRYFLTHKLKLIFKLFHIFFCFFFFDFMTLQPLLSILIIILKSMEYYFHLIRS